MKAVVGLGNPGASYAFTRHNIGFMVMDILSPSSWKTAHQSKISKINLENRSVLLIKPQTYMNRSGQAVKEVLLYYKISIEDLLVVHDDIDQSFLSMKFQKSRGAGGHNGAADIHQCLGSSDYYRLKLGIRSEFFQLSKPDTGSYVLSPFDKSEMKALEEFISKSASAVQYFILNGGEKASNIYNQKNIE